MTSLWRRFQWNDVSRACDSPWDLNVDNTLALHPINPFIPSSLWSNYWRFREIRLNHVCTLVWHNFGTWNDVTVFASEAFFSITYIERGDDLRWPWILVIVALSPGFVISGTNRQYIHWQDSLGTNLETVTKIHTMLSRDRCVIKALIIIMH